MKLRNKKTGEIVDVTMPVKSGDGWRLSANSLAELNEEWEDCEEPKKGWYLDGIGKPIKIVFGDDDFIQTLEAIGNHFKTEEEAEKAVEKLKAWKRLKDKGVRFGKRRHSHYGGEMFWECPNGTGVSDKQIWKDLDLLFGGEE